MVLGFLRLCRHFAIKRKLQEEQSAKKPKLEIKEEVQEEEEEEENEDVKDSSSASELQFYDIKKEKILELIVPNIKAEKIEEEIDVVGDDNNDEEKEEVEEEEEEEVVPILQPLHYESFIAFKFSSCSLKEKEKASSSSDDILQNRELYFPPRECKGKKRSKNCRHHHHHHHHHRRRKRRKKKKETCSKKNNKSRNEFKNKGLLCRDFKKCPSDVAGIRWKRQLRVKLFDIAKDVRFFHIFHSSGIRMGSLTPAPPSEASSSGVSDMSDHQNRQISSGSPAATAVSTASATITADNNVGSSSSSSGIGSTAGSSTSSDYQRSTPSPRDVEMYLEDSSALSFQVHDEFVDAQLQSEKPFYFNNEKCDYKKISSSESVVTVDKNLNADPKIMCQKVKVRLKKLEEILRPPKRRKKHKKKKKCRHHLRTFIQCANLIRPARLKVPDSPLMHQERYFFSRKFSSQQPSVIHNPFSKPQSSFLFGGDNDFERATEEDFFRLQNDLTDVTSSAVDDEDYGIEEDFSSINRDEEEESLPPLIPIECLDELAPSDEERLFQLQQLLPETTPTTTVEEKGDPVNNLITSSVPPPQDAQQPKIRFPPLEKPPNNMIDCKWKTCSMKFTTYGKLSDHLKLAHVVGQANREMFQCLWEGCKVYGKKSCSKSWLEKHVPTHGGKFAFACIVSGCKLRFSSQKMLQKHINNHFSKSNNDPAHIVQKKISDCNNSESTKNLKKAGVKLKYRKTVFSARIFDFFDTGIMAGIKHGLASMEHRKAELGLRENDVITFTSKVIARKTQFDGTRYVLLTWTPKDLLEDEWFPCADAPTSKTIKICHLPEIAKVRLGQSLGLFKCGPPRSKQRRKRVHPPSKV